MDQHYKAAHKQAESLKNKAIDMLDDKTHAHARTLVSGAQEIMQHLQVKLNPRSIEDKIKRLVRHLEEMKREGDVVMDFQHIDFLKRQYEELGAEMRQFDNY